MKEVPWCCMECHFFLERDKWIENTWLVFESLSMGRVGFAKDRFGSTTCSTKVCLRGSSWEGIGRYCWAMKQDSNNCDASSFWGKWKVKWSLMHNMQGNFTFSLLPWTIFLLVGCLSSTWWPKVSDILCCETIDDSREEDTWDEDHTFNTSIILGHKWIRWSPLQRWQGNFNLHPIFLGFSTMLVLPSWLAVDGCGHPTWWPKVGSFPQYLSMGVRVMPLVWWLEVGSYPQPYLHSPVACNQYDDWGLRFCLLDFSSSSYSLSSSFVTHGY